MTLHAEITSVFGGSESWANIQTCSVQILLKKEKLTTKCRKYGNISIWLNQKLCIYFRHKEKEHRKQKLNQISKNSHKKIVQIYESGKAMVVHDSLHQQRAIKNNDDSLVNTSPFHSQIYFGFISLFLLTITFFSSSVET